MSSEERNLIPVRGAAHFRITGRRTEDRRIPKRQPILVGAFVVAFIMAHNYPSGIQIDSPSGMATPAGSVDIAGSVSNPRIPSVTMLSAGGRFIVPVSDGKFSQSIPLVPGWNQIRALPGGVAGALVPGSKSVSVLRPQPGTGPSVGVHASDVQEFDVSLGQPPRPGQTFGLVGGGCYYRGRIKLAPEFTVPGDGTVHVRLDSDHATRTDLQRGNCGGLAAIGFGESLMDLDPVARIVEIRGTFDRGQAANRLADGNERLLVIPRGATRLLRVEFDWEWEQNRKTLVF